MNQKRNIPISLPSMGQEEWEALKEPVFSGWITQGPKVSEFETIFAERHQVKHALAVSNCTTALHLALVALGIKAGVALLGNRTDLSLGGKEETVPFLFLAWGRKNGKH